MRPATNASHDVIRLGLTESGAAKISPACDCQNYPESHPLSAPDGPAAHAMKSGDDYPQQDVVQLEIGLDKLEALFDTGALCAADVHCLNCAAKDCIWNLCLAVCAKRMQCSLASSRLYGRCSQHRDIASRDSSVHIGLKRELLAHI